MSLACGLTAHYSLMKLVAVVASYAALVGTLMGLLARVARPIRRLQRNVLM